MSFPDPDESGTCSFPEQDFPRVRPRADTADPGWRRAESGDTVSRAETGDESRGTRGRWIPAGRGIPRYLTRQNP